MSGLTFLISSILRSLVMYKEQGAKFVPKIIEMLAKGGSESPIDITHAVGIDICSEEFWQKGFDVIEKMIDEIE